MAQFDQASATGATHDATECGSETTELDRDIVECVQRMEQLLRESPGAGSVRVKFANGFAVLAGVDTVEQLTKKLRSGPLGKEVDRLVELCDKRGVSIKGIQHGELEVNLRDGGISDLGVLLRFRY